MSAAVNVGQNRRFKIGWIVLLVAAGLMALNHFMLMFVLDNPVLFLGFGAFNLYSLLVVAIPFARRERWAWYATWILPVVLAAVGFMDRELTLIYSVVATACVVGLVLTVREFFSVDR